MSKKAKDVDRNKVKGMKEVDILTIINDLLDEMIEVKDLIKDLDTRLKALEQ